MRLLASLSSIFMLLAVSASGQSGNPAGMTPGTGPEQPNKTARVIAIARVDIARANLPFVRAIATSGLDKTCGPSEPRSTCSS